MPVAYQAVLREILVLHEQTYQRVRVSVDARARPRLPHTSTEALRLLVREFANRGIPPDEVRADLVHVLQVREQDAIRERSVAHLGDDVWHPKTWGRALTRDPGVEVRRPPVSAAAAEFSPRILALVGRREP